MVERTAGDGSTEFGVPGKAAASELEAPDAAGLDRLINLLSSCWSGFDAVATVAPAELRKGPRGGGRDRDPIAEHVLGAESGYSRQLGLRLNPPAYRDQPALTVFREALIAGIRNSAAAWKPGDKGWPARYAVRRIAWHALDHAWEIEDRSLDGAPHSRRP